jgi:hypothetical protein
MGSVKMGSSHERAYSLGICMYVQGYLKIIISYLQVSSSFLTNFRIIDWGDLGLLFSFATWINFE